ncbi:D-alanyl-D-alanine carboxypeptidase family protein [Ruminococcus flavefaciens]|uniref:D-alanyl-D-alanine carboxypeptidase family protein n=1 Tax=Ruminococcus flavefaciens TaxID=1265 RepID=UPI00046454C7|nr:D-alanyl-D-alanine carboxypeptidase family protein [Ruminococcus flavefaciens]
MKGLVAVFSSFIIVWGALGGLTAFGAEPPEISAKAAVVISADTGEVIYAHNAAEKLPMASTTKIMTTLLCLESGGLYDEFTVDSEAIKVEGSSMGLREGDIVTKYALCCGMLLPSGNDAANAAAVKISGSIEKFAELMNDRAREMGLSKTYFVTPSGLEGEGHGSSAADMALLAREALKNDIFRDICSKSSIKLRFGAPPYERWLKNTNKLLTMYDGVYGVKTGFTDEAGRCLVSACERDGKDLICVTLNDRNDWNDHMALYDYGFQTARLMEVPLPADITADIVGGSSEKIRLAPKESTVSVTTAAGVVNDFEFTVIGQPFLYAPIKSGEEAGKLRISYLGGEVETVPLYAAEDIAYKNIRSESSEKGLLARIKETLGRSFSR